MGVFVPRESYSLKTGPERPVHARQTETPVGRCSASNAQVSNLKERKRCGNLGGDLLGFLAQLSLSKGQFVISGKMCPPKEGNLPIYRVLGNGAPD